MNADRIQKIRKAIGHEKIVVLTDIFKRSAGTPPGVRADRYRADNPGWIEILDRLEVDQLFLQRQQRDQGNYQVRVYALPILEDAHAHELVRNMDNVYALFKTIYREQLSSPLGLIDLFPALGIKTGTVEEQVTKEALSYMADSHAVWSSISIGFPYVTDAQITISEAVLRHDNFTAVLSEFFDWHIFNAQKRANAPLIASHAGSDGQEERFSFVGQTEAQRPAWYDKLDDSKKALIAELDVALENELAALPTMGLRTLLELIILDHIIHSKGSFKKNLEAFAEAGFITEQHAAVIGNVVDIGHAAIHRAYFPNRSDLETCVETVKHLIHGVYILKPKIDAMSANTPKRSDGNSGGDGAGA
jgi:Domain of unknown function (DUF4145)